MKGQRRGKKIFIKINYISEKNRNFAIQNTENY